MMDLPPLTSQKIQGTVTSRAVKRMFNMLVLGLVGMEITAITSTLGIKSFNNRNFKENNFKKKKKFS